MYPYDPQALIKFKVPENGLVFEKVIDVLKETDSLEAAALEEKFRNAAAQSGRKFGEARSPNDRFRYPLGFASRLHSRSIL